MKISSQIKKIKAGCRWLLPVLLLVLLNGTVCPATAKEGARKQEVRPLAAPGQVVFRLKDTAGAPDGKEIKQKKLRRKYCFKDIRPLGPGRNARGRRKIFRAILTDEEQGAEALRLLKDDPEVEWAEPVYYRYCEQEEEEPVVPDDPRYSDQAYLNVMAFPLAAARRYVALGADMVWFGDDVSHQQGMMFSLETWRTFLKPRYARLFAAVREADPEVKIAYHSCGNCEAILDDMVEIGLHVLNPVQPTALDPFRIKKRYGKKLSLFGGLCVQHTLPHGTPAEVRAAAARLKKECGAGGGYILSPAHHIQADTPLENVRAFYEEALTTKE